MPASLARSETVLVMTPTGRDAQLICSALSRSGIEAQFYGCATDLVVAATEGAGAAVIADECLSAATKGVLLEFVTGQAPWSDFPFIVLTGGGDLPASSPAAYRMVEQLGNVTLLERPLRAVTLVIAVQAALRARRRQYEAQSYIAERVQAEEALARQAGELATSNADLQQFAYVTSHDLQEPLRTIRCFAELAARELNGSARPEVREHLGQVAGAAARMQDLVRDLLDYSRLVNVEPRPFAPVPLDSVVRWALQNLDSAVSDSGATVSWSDLPVVRGDHIKLVQLLQNLLGNAIKYRRNGVPPVISIDARPDGAHWIIRVRDNGQGIDPEYRERVFGLFKRLHDQSVPGTGIGLSICRKIVEQHDGRIWVESGAEPGADFCFTLPAVS